VLPHVHRNEGKASPIRHSNGLRPQAKFKNLNISHEKKDN